MIHRDVIDPCKFTEEDINRMVDPRANYGMLSVWREAFSLWSCSFGKSAPKFFGTDSTDGDFLSTLIKSFDGEEKIATGLTTFRVTGQRRGLKGKVGSDSIASHLGSILYHCSNDLIVNLVTYDMNVFIDMNMDQLLIGIALSSERVSLRNRKELGATTLNAANAYALIHWANIQPGEIVIDPMGGAGTIPVEGSQIHPQSFFLSSDIYLNVVKSSSQNISTFSNNSNADAFCADITKIPLRPQCVDVCVSDLPFGRRHGSINANKSLYPALFKQMERFLRSGGRAVLLTMAKAVIKSVIECRRKMGWTLVKEVPLEVGGYRCWVFELSYEFKPMASNANKKLAKLLAAKMSGSQT